MKTIDAICYRKRTGEYMVKERDTETGQVSQTFANHLTEAEKMFARLHCSRYETPYEITWTHHNGQ